MTNKPFPKLLVNHLMATYPGSKSHAYLIRINIIVSDINSKELKSADSSQLPASTPSISRMRTSVSLIRLKKDTDTQTPVKLSVKELILESSSSSMDPEQNFFKVSSKCSASCAAKKSESLKFLKEPCCANSSCESLAQKMSSIM